MLLALLKQLAILGMIPWMVSPFFALLFKHYVPVLQGMRLPEWQDAYLPKLSVLVPACNEEDTIEASLRTLLAQDYPDLEIVVVNDRSTDETGVIIDRLAQEDARIRTVHIERLPEGWLGKVHALHHASVQATGEWLLFTDADIHFSKDCLRRSLVYAMHNGLDHLALLPKMTSRSMWARFAIVSALRAILVAVKPWNVNDPTQSEGVGVGAFNLVRRAAFEQTAGFEWFKMDVADDVALGQLMKNATGQSHVLIAHQDVEVEWYPSVKKVFLGLEKNAFAQVARCDLRQGMLIGGLALWIAISPIFLWCMGENFWALLPWIGAFSTAMIFHNSIGLSFLDTLGSFVFGDLLMGAVIIRSTWLGAERGGVIWRGTVYSSEELRSGMRIQFGNWLAELLKK